MITPKEQLPNSHPIASAWLEAIRPYAVNPSHANLYNATIFNSLLKQREACEPRDPLQRLAKKRRGDEETLLDTSRRHELVPILQYLDALEQEKDEQVRKEAIFTCYKGLYKGLCKNILRPAHGNVDKAGTTGRLAELAVGLTLHYPYNDQPDSLFVPALRFQDRIQESNHGKRSHDGVYLDIEKGEAQQVVRVQVKAGLNYAAFNYMPSTAIIIASLDLDPRPFLPPVPTGKPLGKKLLTGVLPRLLFSSTYGFRDEEVSEALTEVSKRLHKRLADWHINGSDRLAELSRILKEKRAGNKATYKCLEGQ